MLRRLLFLSVLFVPLGARAQEARLQLAYQPGVRYTLTQVDSMEMQLGIVFDGQATPSAAPMRMATLSVADFTVEPRGEEWLMTRVERRRRTWSDGPGGVESVDTDTAASVAASPNGPLAMALVGRPIRMRMARDGRVLELLGRDSLLAAVLDALPGSPDLREALRPAFAGLLDGLTALTYTLPPAATPVGGTWTQTAPGAGPVPLEIEQHYTLDALTGDQAQIRFTTAFRLPPDAPPMGMGPMAFRMQMDGAGTGTWRLDLRDGTSTAFMRAHVAGGGTPVEAPPGMPAMQMQMQQESRSWTIVTRADG